MSFVFNENDPTTPHTSQSDTSADARERGEPDVGASSGASVAERNQSSRTSVSWWIRQHRCWAACFSVGLLVEIATTLWTVTQAMSLGVFEEAHCGPLPFFWLLNERIPPQCEQLDASKVFFEHHDGDKRRSGGITLQYVGCSSLLGPTYTKQMRLCDWPWTNQSSGCAWTTARPVVESLGAFCVAMPVVELSAADQARHNTTQEWTLQTLPRENGITVHPPKSGKVTTALLVVGLGIELVEATVGYTYFRDPFKDPDLMAAGSALEAAGILTFHVWLMTSGSYWFQWETELSIRRELFVGMVVKAAVMSTCLGALIVAIFHCSRAAAHRLPYLGTVGDALIWLGGGLTEVLVSLYLSWRLDLSQLCSNDRFSTWGNLFDYVWNDVSSEIIQLLFFEVLALAALSTSRALFTKAKTALKNATGLDKQPWVEAMRLAAATPAQNTPRRPSNTLSLLLALSLVCFVYIVAVSCFQRGLGIGTWDVFGIPTSSGGEDPFFSDYGGA
ncbi:unnamed protein product [Ectocarpus sp. 6 AP-2014]